MALTQAEIDRLAAMPVPTGRLLIDSDFSDGEAEPLPGAPLTMAAGRTKALPPAKRSCSSWPTCRARTAWSGAFAPGWCM